MDMCEFLEILISSVCVRKLILKFHMIGNVFTLNIGRP